MGWEPPRPRQIVGGSICYTVSLKTGHGHGPASLEAGDTTLGVERVVAALFVSLNHAFLYELVESVSNLVLAG